MTRLAIPVLVLALGACTAFPELEGLVPADVAASPYPALLPIEAVLGAPAEARATGAEAEALTARAEALRTRAAALRLR